MPSTQTITQPVNTRPSLFSLQELFALPPESTPFIVEGLLPNSGVSLLTGRPKAGKSHFARQLVASIANEESFLGRTVIPGDVLYYALEEKAQEVRDHFFTLGLQQARHEVLTQIGAVYERPMEALVELIDAHQELRLIIIDPLMRLMRLRDGNSYSEVTAAMEKLMTIARDREVHIMAVHHTTKRKTEDPLDATLGSQAINGAVDTILTLQETNGNRVISSSQRYGIGLKQTSLVWDATSRRMSLGGTFEARENLPHSTQSCSLEDRILKELAHSPGTEYPALRAKLNVKGLALYAALRILQEAGSIVRLGGGVRGNPHKYYLAEIGKEGSSA